MVICQIKFYYYFIFLVSAKLNSCQIYNFSASTKLNSTKSAKFSSRNPHTTKRSLYIQTTHLKPSKCNSHTYIDSQNIYIPNTELTSPPNNFYCPLKLPAHLSSMGYPKFTSQAALLALFFLSVMVQLTISLPTLPISSSP